jgi:hypothetical protein
MYAASSARVSLDQDENRAEDEIGSLRYDGGAGGKKKDAGSDDDMLTDGLAPDGTVGLFYFYLRSLLLVY